MIDTGHMNYFTVNHCGLYKTGKTQVFGLDLTETFDLISGWVKTRPFSQTIPWDPQTSKKNKSKCYCKDIEKDPATGDFVVVLWKSDTDNVGTLWGAEEESSVGTSEVVKYTNDYNGKKVIWGRPCYYWVIPSLNTLISIKFDHSVCDTDLFEDYVINCITNRIQHPSRKKTITEGGLVRISHEEDEHQRYLYRFGVSLKSVQSYQSELVKLSTKVTHIIRRETVMVNSKDERAEWVKIFNDYVPFVAAKPKTTQRKIEVRIEAKPTLAEMKEIIEKNAKENREKSEWNNVGFATDAGVAWVDSYRLREILLASREGKSLFSAQQLLKEISQNRASFLRFLKDEPSVKQG